MTAPTPAGTWQIVRSDERRWFHNEQQREIIFALDGTVSFFVQGEHLRMGQLDLPLAEMDWIIAHRDWLLKQETP